MILFFYIYNANMNFESTRKYKTLFLGYGRMSGIWLMSFTFIRLQTSKMMSVKFYGHSVAFGVQFSLPFMDIFVRVQQQCEIEL